MLVLSRQKDQVIIIGDNIEIKIVDVQGDKVRLGITAPDNVSIDRLEIRESKLRGEPAPNSIGNRKREDVDGNKRTVDSMFKK